jgi:hypothetical protein
MATNISNLTETKYFSIILKTFTRMLIDGRKMCAKIHNPWNEFGITGNFVPDRKIYPK